MKGDGLFQSENEYLGWNDPEQREWDRVAKRNRKAAGVLLEIESYCEKHNTKNHVSRQVLKLIKQWREQ